MYYNFLEDGDKCLKIYFIFICKWLEVNIWWYLKYRLIVYLYNFNKYIYVSIRVVCLKKLLVD